MGDPVRGFRVAVLVPKEKALIPGLLCFHRPFLPDGDSSHLLKQIKYTGHRSTYHTPPDWYQVAFCSSVGIRSFGLIPFFRSC